MEHSFRINIRKEHSTPALRRSCGIASFGQSTPSASGMCCVIFCVFFLKKKRFGCRMPLFLFIFHIFYNISTFISHLYAIYNTFIHRHSLGPLFISSLLESSVGRPSLWCRAENRTYSKPTRYQLSHAAPLILRIIIIPHFPFRVCWGMKICQMKRSFSVDSTLLLPQSSKVIRDDCRYYNCLLCEYFHLKYSLFLCRPDLTRNLLLYAQKAYLNMTNFCASVPVLIRHSQSYCILS
jgi:hypothetical protein